GLWCAGRYRRLGAQGERLGVSAGEERASRDCKTMGWQLLFKAFRSTDLDYPWPKPIDGQR
ncbi:MAG: hypothetical protein KKE86_05220, partial [Planctomycetes bacterium]|nr:hypothetical protein [Planctomycetota bacterium]MBU4398720.1 hypothetical protein [Planctomycetota bacterium]MCG2683385.1 hypothetical protein [Planctomycetales bacterium]